MAKTRSATLVNPTTKEIVKIEYFRDFWEDEYGSGHTDHSVLYEMYDQTGKRLKTKVVTPSNRVLSDYEALVYYIDAIKTFECLGYLQIPELIKAKTISVNECYPL